MCGHYTLKMDQTIWCEGCGREWDINETSALLFLNLQRLQWRIDSLENIMETQLANKDASNVNVQ
jgi:hypothetical protein